MTRAAVPIADLPPHLQRRARARATGLPGVELGPESPLLELPAARSRKKRDPGEEHAEQIKVIAWADDPETQRRYPELDALYSIPNESFGRRDGGDKKARGRRKGMVDLCLPVARRALDGSVYGSCYIEMKALTGVVRESQQERIRILRARGNFVDVAWSADAAIAIFERYLRLPKPASVEGSYDVLQMAPARSGRWKVHHAPKKIEGCHPWEPGCWAVRGDYDVEDDARRIVDAFNALEAERADR